MLCAEGYSPTFPLCSLTNITTQTGHNNSHFVWHSPGHVIALTEMCNIMQTPERMYQKNITHAFKISFHSIGTDIAVAVEGHTVGLHNLQTGKKKKNV